jgi:hypothetical protein
MLQFRGFRPKEKEVKKRRCSEEQFIAALKEHQAGIEQPKTPEPRN